MLMQLMEYTERLLLVPDPDTELKKYNRGLKALDSNCKRSNNLTLLLNTKMLLA